MSFPMYERYKDSGVEWLGKVPEGWAVCRVRNLLLDSYDGIKIGPFGSQLTAEMLSESGYKVYGQENVISKDYSKGDRFISAEKFDELSVYEIKSGDILITMMGTSGRCDVVPDDAEAGIMDSHLLRIRTKPLVFHDFFRSLIHEAPYVKFQIVVMGKGSIMHGLNSTIVKNLCLAIPPFAEQHAIATFLDRETAKIDALIDEQENLIELLKEKIKSMVLTPLDSPATQKFRLGAVAELINRPVIQREEEIYIPIGLYNRGRGVFHKDSREMKDMGDSDFFWIKEGDLIISGQFAWEGSVALADKADDGCVVSHRYPVLRGRDGVATEYLFALLTTKHGDFLLNENSRGAAGRNRPLNINLLMKEKIPVPTFSIQKKVARSVHVTNEISKEIHKEIGLLKERRTALISAAVTGKIDVRGLAAAQR